MRQSILLSVLAAASALCVAAGFSTPKVIENGTFDHPKGPLHGWITDYAFSGNQHYVGNKGRVKAVPSESGRTKVVKITPAGDAGAKMECIPIPFEPGTRYTCKLDIKGGAYRVYFAGYKWKPGIRPHENPKLGELRMIYKSKAATGNASSWKQEKIELPGVKLSAQAIKHLKYVRFITVYVYTIGEAYVDNVKVEKRKDPSIKM